LSPIFGGIASLDLAGIDLSNIQISTLPSLADSLDAVNSDAELITVTANINLTTVNGGLNLPSSRIFGSLDDIGELFSNSIDGFRLGRAGELAARNRFLREGRLIAGEQVFVRTARGGLRITDFLLTDGKGNFAGAEIKVNSATRSFNQLFNDGIIASQGGTIVSRGPLGFGLTAGTMIRFDTFELNVTITR
jgi:hypothetical protein